MCFWTLGRYHVARSLDWVVCRWCILLASLPWWSCLIFVWAKLSRWFGRRVGRLLYPTLILSTFRKLQDFIHCLIAACFLSRDSIRTSSYPNSIKRSPLLPCFWHFPSSKGGRCKWGRVWGSGRKLLSKRCRLSPLTCRVPSRTFPATPKNSMALH